MATISAGPRHRPSRGSLTTMQGRLANLARSRSPSREGHSQPARSALAEWAVTILLYLFVCTTLVQAFVIPTGSMEESLLIGDHVLVDKLAYAPPGAISRFLLPYQKVERGDIVVFRYPVDLDQIFVKRIVGVPGDCLRIVDKRLWINGSPVTEPYASFKTDTVEAYRDNFPSSKYPEHIYEPAVRMLREHVTAGELHVPEGNYFAMGDNRDHSLDSRYWGFVPRDHIVGKPLLIWWSYDAPTERLLSPGVSLEHLKDLAAHFVSKTRWERTFRLIRAHDL